MFEARHGFVFATCVTAISVAFAPTSAAAQKPAGQWLVRWESSAKGGHGDVTPPTEVRGRITIQQVKDSVFGTWLYSAPPGEPAPFANELRGVLRHDTVSVSVVPAVDPDASALGIMLQDFGEWVKQHVHGIAPTVTQYEFTVRGDSLSGVRRVVAVDGSVKDRVFVLSGTRVKGK